MASIDKILITGASGYLGHSLAAAASKRYQTFGAFRTNLQYVPLSVHPLRLDVTRKSDVLAAFSRIKPDTVIHTAAQNPGKNGQSMAEVNVSGTRHVAEAARLCGARMIHISSDIVHDGKHPPYTDDAAPTPVNPYGESKALAEGEVAALLKHFTIVRTSLIYSLRRMPYGTMDLARRLRAGARVQLVHDAIRQPIWIETLVAALQNLLDKPDQGFLNIAGREALSRESYERKLLRWWGVDDHGRIDSIAAADTGSVPLDLTLSTDKASKLLNTPLLTMDEVFLIGRNMG